MVQMKFVTPRLPMRSQITCILQSRPLGYNCTHCSGSLLLQCKLFYRHGQPSTFYVVGAVQSLPTEAIWIL